MAWYLWAILGVLAIVFEMISPTFFALFIGIGFLCSSAIAFFLPNAFTASKALLDQWVRFSIQLQNNSSSCIDFRNALKF